MRVITFLLLWSVALLAENGFESIRYQPDLNHSTAETIEYDLGDETIINSVAYQQSELIAKKMDNELYYVLLLGALSMLTLVISLSFLKHRRHSTADIVHLIGLVLIIYGTIILVLIVETQEQLTAAIGIMGAIAGYLFRSVQDIAVSEEKEVTIEKGGKNG